MKHSFVSAPSEEPIFSLVDLVLYRGEGKKLNEFCCQCIKLIHTCGDSSNFSIIFPVYYPIINGERIGSC